VYKLAILIFSVGCRRQYFSRAVHAYTHCGRCVSRESGTNFALNVLHNVPPRVKMRRWFHSLWGAPRTHVPARFRSLQPLNGRPMQIFSVKDSNDQHTLYLFCRLAAAHFLREINGRERLCVPSLLYMMRMYIK
jgi:hypothetical protein